MSLIRLYIITILLLFVTKNYSQIICGDSTSSNVDYFRVDSVFSNSDPHQCTSDTIEIDINEDAIPDVKFRFFNCLSPGGTAASLTARIINPQLQFIVTVPNGLGIDSLRTGITINNNYNWFYSTSNFILESHQYTPQSSSSTGDFPSNTGFIGFRILGNNDTIYGWMYLKSRIIKSYAIEKNLQSLTENNDVPNSLIYPNPTNGYVFINKINLNNSINSIYIIDLLGKKQEVLLNDKNFIDLSGLCNGIYTMQFNTSARSFSTKIIILH